MLRAWERIIHRFMRFLGEGRGLSFRGTSHPRWVSLAIAFRGSEWRRNGSRLSPGKQEKIRRLHVFKHDFFTCAQGEEVFLNGMRNYLMLKGNPAQPGRVSKHARYPMQRILAATLLPP